MKRLKNTALDFNNDVNHNGAVHKRAQPRGQAQRSVAPLTAPIHPRVPSHAVARRPRVRRRDPRAPRIERM